MTELQTLYRKLYSQLAAEMQSGDDVAGNDWCFFLRAQLEVCWRGMSVVERQSFLSPQVLEHDEPSPVSEVHLKSRRVKPRHAAHTLHTSRRKGVRLDMDSSSQQTALGKLES